MRVRKVEGGYYARVGDFFGAAKATTNEAIAALDKELEAYHPLNHTYVRCEDGTVLHVFQIPTAGWSYHIIPPSGDAGQARGGYGTHREAQEGALAYARTTGGGLVHDGVVRQASAGVVGINHMPPIPIQGPRHSGTAGHSQASEARRDDSNGLGRGAASPEDVGQ
jgi:hypothetical protein